MPAFRLLDHRETELEAEWLEEAIQRFLSRIVSRIDGSQDVGAWHPNLPCEFLHTHGADRFS